MLFDLRTGRRRRVVQVVFGGLAVIFAVTFVGFGIGSDAQGGILDAIGLGGGGQGGGATSNPQFEEEIESAEERLEANPTDRGALLTLVQTYFNSGNSALETDPETGGVAFTDDALSDYRNAVDAWQRYLETDPPKPETGAGNAALIAYESVLPQTEASSPEFDATLAGWLETARLLSSADPSLRNLQALAQAAYVNGETKLGDRTAERALAEASASEKQTLKQLFKFAKQVPEQLERQREASAASEEELIDPLGDLGTPGAPPGAGGGGQPAP